MILLGDSECPNQNGQADLSLRCPQMPKDTFSHVAAHTFIILFKDTFFPSLARLTSHDQSNYRAHIKGLSYLSDYKLYPARRIHLRFQGKAYLSTSMNFHKQCFSFTSMF